MRWTWLSWNKPSREDGRDRRTGVGGQGEEQVSQQLASAVERYRGPFLEGFSVTAPPSRSG